MDVSLMIKDFKFNYRVATVIRNGDKVLLHKNKNEDFYAIPGGRIKIGEDSISAIKREVFEEIGVNINVDKMIGLVENFFEYDGKKHHEVMIVFSSSFNKGSEYYNQEIIKGIEKDGELNLVWKSVEDIKELDVRPIKLKNTLINKQDGFFHIVNNS